MDYVEQYRKLQNDVMLLIDDMRIVKENKQECWKKKETIRNRINERKDTISNLDAEIAELRETLKKVNMRIQSHYAAQHFLEAGGAEAEKYRIMNAISGKENQKKEYRQENEVDYAKLNAARSDLSDACDQYNITLGEFRAAKDSLYQLGSYKTLIQLDLMEQIFHVIGDILRNHRFVVREGYGVIYVDYYSSDDVAKPDKHVTFEKRGDKLFFSDSYDSFVQRDNLMEKRLEEIFTEAGEAQPINPPETSTKNFWQKIKSLLGF